VSCQMSIVRCLMYFVSMTEWPIGHSVIGQMLFRNRNIYIGHRTIDI